MNAVWRFRKCVHAAVSVIVVMLAGCGDEEDIMEPGGPVAELVVVSGAGQEGTVSEELPDPLVVAIRREGGGPGISGAMVAISVVSGGGSVRSPSGGGASGNGATWSSQTDGAGELRVTLGHGPEVGRHLFSVHTGYPVRGDTLVDVTTVAGPGPVTRVVKSGDGQAAAAGTVLPVPIALVLSDRFGNAVPGVEVNWDVVSGGGSLSTGTVVTDDYGGAAVEWTLGATVGEQEVFAEAEGVGVFRFVATGL